MKRKKEKLMTRIHSRLKEETAKAKKLAKNKDFWFKMVMLFVLVATVVWASSCGGKVFNYHPKTVMFKSGEGGHIQACRIQANGVTICEYDLDYFEGETFYGFPGSMYKGK